MRMGQGRTANRPTPPTPDSARTPAVPGPFRIRGLARRDLAEVLRIDAYHTGARKPAYWKRVFREFLGDSDSPLRVGLAAQLPRGLAGYLLGEVRAFEFGSEPCGWIFAVGVDPAALRHGVGTALVTEACRRFHAAGVSTVRTMVRRNDVPVLAFFRSSGFSGGPYVQLELEVRDTR
jgi:ribosomal protein S18 acetylase RimI-like enzyme